MIRIMMWQMNADPAYLSLVEDLLSDPAVRSMDALPQRTPPAPAKAPKPADHTTAYGQLVLAGEKLMALIGRMEKRSSKDQARLTRHIHTLVRKFARR